MSTKYAEGTSVSIERSRNELERLLRRFGADEFVSGWQAAPERYVIGFRMANHRVRIDLPMPESDDPQFRMTPAGRVRATSATRELYDQEIRRRWRSLLLVVKAKLTAVADGISTLEREFLADVVLPDGRTLGQTVGPQLNEIARTGIAPQLMPGGTP